MPYKREFRLQEVSVASGGQLAPDVPPDQVGPADYTVRENWRYEDGAEVEREGWADYQPNPAIAASTSKVMGTSIQQIGEAIRGNGEKVPVGVSADKVYYWNWTSGAWTQIGSGYSTSPARRWQIINLGSYCIFNNGTDLPFTWVPGDSAVKPIYELREQGYACVGEILAMNRMLKCFDVTEILSAELSGILNGADPYGPVAANKTQRIGYREVWSNIDDPRDFAAVVPGTGTAGSPNLTLDWPMASLKNGDEITILGAGAAGGNLTTTISNISGTAVTLATNIVTSVTDADTQKSTAINSIVAWSDDLMGDGSEVLRAMKLQNRVVVYKANGQIFTGYYTGDVDQPWVYDSAYSADGDSRGLRFPYTLIDVAGRYHLYAGDRHFYVFSLGYQEPQQHPVLKLCERTLFFNKIAAYTTDYSTIKNKVYAAMNGCTSEIFFRVPGSGAAAFALAYDFANERASVVTGYDFDCAATIHKPTALRTADQQELYFIMGSGANVTTYGRTNLNLITMTRNGSTFDRTLESGLIHFGQARQEKVVRSYTTVCQTQNVQVAVTIYGTDHPAETVASLATFNLNGSGQALIQYLHLVKNYFKEKLVVSAGGGARISGRIWDVGLVRDTGITRST
jgi:hypothetical protein